MVMKEKPTEPALDDLLADEMVRLLMRRDGVKSGLIRQLLRRVRLLREPPVQPSGPFRPEAAGVRELASL